MSNREQTLIYNKAFEVRQSSSLVFFLCPFNARISQFHIPIQKLNKKGYTVIAYEFSNDVLETGDPENLEILVEQALTEAKLVISQKISEGYEDFGVVGGSLGSFVGLHLLGRIPEIKRGVLVSGVYTPRTLWRMKMPREAFESNGHSLEFMLKRWHDVTHPVRLQMSNKLVIVTQSSGDELVKIGESNFVYELMKNCGAEVELINHIITNHKYTIIRDLMRINTLISKISAK